MLESFELYVESDGGIIMPLTVDGCRWETRRRGAPGKLTFSVVQDGKFNMEKGGAVRLTVNGDNLFFGFGFSKRRDKSPIIDVVAYDQMRYLKNKDTYIYTNKTASDVIRMVASDFNLQLGVIENTSFVIPCRVDDNTALFDVIYNALDLDLTNTGDLYVFFDDFGKLTLKSLESMKLDLLIDCESGENFDYKSSINDSTYNRIKLVFENNETGMRDIYLVQHGENINRWGILQYYATLQEGESGEAKAHALLNLFNAPTRKLRLQNMFGDTRVRAGSMPVIMLDLGDVQLQNHMLVEKCVHIFRESEHFMDLTMRGGEFVG